MNQPRTQSPAKVADKAVDLKKRILYKGDPQSLMQGNWKIDIWEGGVVQPTFGIRVSNPAAKTRPTITIDLEMKRKGQVLSERDTIRPDLERIAIRGGYFESIVERDRGMCGEAQEEYRGRDGSWEAIFNLQNMKELESGAYLTSLAISINNGPTVHFIRITEIIHTRAPGETNSVSDEYDELKRRLESAK